MGAHSPNFIANGTINPSCFVVCDTVVNNAVDQASAATSFIMGVSQEWSKFAPIPSATQEAADVGDSLKVYSVGEVCLLQATSAGWTQGDRLTSNALGQGITATGTNYYGAVALTTVTGVAQLGRVLVLLGKNP
jgi:hypothetical protein